MVIQGFIIAVLLIVLIVLGNYSSKTGKKTTNARWADRLDKLNAFKKAQKQLSSKKVNDVCLWCGKFDPNNYNWFWGQIKLLVTGKLPTVFLTDANQSIEVLGRPKSGKTFIIDRILTSAIDRRIPILLYSYKGGKTGVGSQIPFVCGYAAKQIAKYNKLNPKKKRKLKLRFYALGNILSSRINLVKRIRHNKDITTSMNLAIAFHENLVDPNARQDGFFGPIGKQVLAALFLLARGTPYPDLAMAFAFLQLPEFAQRLFYAVEQKNPKFEFWSKVAFNQLIQVANAERTSSGIIADASKILTQFMQYDLLPAYIGESNTDLYMGEGEILVILNDIERQKVLNPINSAVISTLINVNFAEQRSIPLLACFDELKTAGKIPNLTTYANEHRSKGYIGVYGYQMISQPEDLFGVNGVKDFRGPLGTRFWLNPGDLETAELFSKYIGVTEEKIVNKSTTGVFSKQVPMTEQIREVPLIRPDKFTKFGQGETVLISPGYGSKGRGNSDIPQHFDPLPISQKEIDEIEEYEKFYFEKVLPQLINKGKIENSKLDVEEELKKRIEYAETMFPLPPKKRRKPPNI